MTFNSQSLFDGRLRGRGGSARGRLCKTLTNRVMFAPEGCRANGSFAVSFVMLRAGQIMISHLNGSFLAIAARRADSLTSSRTTNVPTAPMLTISNLANCFAMSAGWHRFVRPTFTARRNTTQRIRSLLAPRRATELRMSRTGHEMIVDHAGRLHQRVADGRTDKLESALNQITAHGVGFRCARRHLSHSPPTIDSRSPARSVASHATNAVYPAASPARRVLLRLATHKTPEICVE